MSCSVKNLGGGGNQTYTESFTYWLNKAYYNSALKTGGAGITVYEGHRFGNFKITGTSGYSIIAWRVYINNALVTTASSPNMSGSDADIKLVLYRTGGGDSQCDWATNYTITIENS